MTLLEDQVRDFFLAGREAMASDRQEVLHQFRIAVKRLRYSIEILSPESGAERLKRLKTLQEILGDMNDAFVAEAYLRGLPKLSPRSRPLPAELQKLAHEHIEAFRKFWKETMDAPGQEGDWAQWASG